MSEKNPRLRWKRNPRETGLRSVVAGPRGWTLHDGQESYATVNALGGDWSRPFAGWYWVAYSRPGIRLRNTCDTPLQDPEEAKAEAMAYVKAGLATDA